MKFRLAILFLITMVFFSTCRKDDYIICDCFDDEDFSYSFLVNIKSYRKDLSVYNFLYTRDSLRRPVYYNISVTTGDSFVYAPEFNWRGSGKDQDSMVGFTVWASSKRPREVIISSDSLDLKHVFTGFELEGFGSGEKECKCFTPTKKTVLMDDSITLDVLHAPVLIKK